MPLYFKGKFAVFARADTPALMPVADFACATVVCAIGRLIDDDKSNSGNE